VASAIISVAAQGACRVYTLNSKTGDIFEMVFTCNLQVALEVSATVEEIDQMMQSDDLFDYLDYLNNLIIFLRPSQV
jgi:hypothetical protein